MTLLNTPRETVEAPTIFVGVVEWGSDDGEREPVVFAAVEQGEVERALAGFLATDYTDHPHCFHDDSTPFMDSPREWALDSVGTPFGPLTASLWLSGLHAATTAPWASVTEVALLGAGVQQR